MGSLEVNWDKEEARAKLEGKLNELPSKALTLIDDMADVSESFMDDEAPVKFGDLQNSITTEVLSDLERWIGPTVAHAIYVIKATSPHIIKGNPFLYWEGADHPVRSVMHPGTAPNDFITRSQERSEGRHSQLVQEFLGWLTE